MRIVITGGGTGGHLFPALAIAEALRERRPDAEILFVGGDRIEARVVPEEGWAFAQVRARGLPRRLGLAAAWSLATTARGTFQALRLLRGWRPDAVVATGGYVCVPVGCAAALLHVPLGVQEQNLRPGLATRLIARWAEWVSIPHPEAAGHLRARRTEVTGIPLRRRAVQGDRRRGLERWGLDSGRTTLLVLGGSLGAMSLNRATCGMGDLLMFEAGLQILHQTGPEHLHWVRREIGHREHVGPPALRHVAVAFLDDIADAYACADLVISRAGAATLAELTAWGLPAILIPYPGAAEAHQEDNARILARDGAAVCLSDADLAGTVLVETVQAIIADPTRRGRMAEASRALGRPGASGAVADLVLGLASRSGPTRRGQEGRS